jgi:hypothetical protein
MSLSAIQSGYYSNYPFDKIRLGILALKGLIDGK